MFGSYLKVHPRKQNIKKVPNKSINRRSNIQQYCLIFFLFPRTFFPGTDEKISPSILINVKLISKGSVITHPANLGVCYIKLHRVCFHLLQNVSEGNHRKEGVAIGFQVEYKVKNMQCCMCE